jgi:PAS domain S-box-containing protein
MSSRVVGAERRTNAQLRRRFNERPAELESLNAELRARSRQQEAVAALSQSAIRERDLAALMKEAAAVTASTLGTEYSAIAEVLEGGFFLPHAGAGWRPGVLGGARSVGCTPAGFMLRSGEPVVIADVRTETRFPIPQPMIDHGVESAIYVIIRVRVRTWGTLSAYATRARAFSRDDIGFLQSVANVLALAIERHDLEVAQRREKEILQSVFDHIPIMVSFYESSGQLLRVNRAWEETLGWTLREAQKLDILAEAYPDAETRKKVVEFISRSDRRWADFKTHTRSGRVIDTAWARYELSDGSRIGFGLDLSERRRVDDALAASEARFAKLFHASPVALGMSTGPTNRIMTVNQSWLDLFGFNLDEVMGRTNQELGIVVGPDPRGPAPELVQRDTGAGAMEIQIRRRSGEVRNVIVSVVPVQLSPNLNCLLSALTDITDRKLAEAERDRLIEEASVSQERLVSLSRRLLTIQEEERRRLAVELHDELGQVLTAVKINLASLARTFALGLAPSPLEDAIASVDHAMHQVRDIALDLRPSVLDDLGLPPALRWYINRFARDVGLEVHVSVDDVPDIDANIATACFRVAQEALSNVARHARARNVWLDLHLKANGLELRVRDDGVGFDPVLSRQRALAGTSMGLLGMQERVSLVNGALEILGGPGEGSEVRALFPLVDKTRRTA